MRGIIAQWAAFLLRVQGPRVRFSARFIDTALLRGWAVQSLIDDRTHLVIVNGSYYSKHTKYDTTEKYSDVLLLMRRENVFFSSCKHALRLLPLFWFSLPLLQQTISYSWKCFYINLQLSRSPEVCMSMNMGATKKPQWKKSYCKKFWTKRRS